MTRWHILQPKKVLRTGSTVNKHFIDAGSGFSYSSFSLKGHSSTVAIRPARLSFDYLFKNPFFIHGIYSLLANIMGISLPNRDRGIEEQR